MPNEYVYLINVSEKYLHFENSIEKERCMHFSLKNAFKKWREIQICDDQAQKMSASMRHIEIFLFFIVQFRKRLRIRDASPIRSFVSLKREKRHPVFLMNDEKR